MSEFISSLDTLAGNFCLVAQDRVIPPLVPRFDSDLVVHSEPDPSLLHRRFPELDCSSTGAGRLLLSVAMLLHIAAEFSSLDCARLLIECEGQVNASVMAGHTGVGGQTPLFQAVSQFRDQGLEITELLLQRGVDLRLRFKLPGHYERQDEFVECTPLGHALRFPGLEFPGSNEAIVRLLREKGGIESCAITCC